MKIPIAAEQKREPILPEKASAGLALTSALLLILVPLSFSTAVYRLYTLPRMAVLLTGSAVLLAMLCGAALDPRLRKPSVQLLNHRHMLLLTLYVVCISISTIFAIAPRNSFFGSFENQTGLLTHLCFFICCISLIIGAGRLWVRLQAILWAMLITALLISVYAVAQFFGIEPFVQAELYRFKSAGATLLRVCGTLGHADYLGNFLLYVAFVAPAFAMISSGRARRIALFASLLIVFAIICSGTRGAWLGLVFGGLVFCFLELKSFAGKAANLSRSQLLVRGALVMVILSTGFALLVANSKSENITMRAKSFFADGLTGSGRTLLWRDAVKMIPEYGLTGCGPEGFRKAFLPYKSKALAQLAPQTNNESSHNSFLDAAISFGLGGLIFYLAIIISTGKLFLEARRRVNSESHRILLSGLLASFAAVILHNFFIFDQLSTGLYFYAFAAIAQIVANVCPPQPVKEKAAENLAEAAVLSATARRPQWKWLSVGIGAMLIIPALWYSFSLVRADRQMKLAFDSAAAKNFAGLLENGERACAAIEPTRAYDFLFAQALVRYAERATAANENQSNLSDTRATALAKAKFHAAKALPHSFTPDSNHLLLAYIAWLSGNPTELKSSAAEAVRLDPYFANARWLMAQSLMAEGLYDEASQQAELAMELNPHLLEAKLAFRKARQNSSAKADLINQYRARSQKAAELGDVQKARRLLLRAVKVSDNACAECHRSLALLYESNHQYDEAIAEWNLFLKAAPERAAGEKVGERVKLLAQKIAAANR
jgi:O-antigen ligase